MSENNKLKRVKGVENIGKKLHVLYQLVISHNETTNFLCSFLNSLNNDLGHNILEFCNFSEKLGLTTSKLVLAI